jgi:hypothetical protein
MLYAVITDFGHCNEKTPRRAHTGLGFADFSPPVQAQFRISTRPLCRHLSQFHAAGEEN